MVSFELFMLENVFVIVVSDLVEVIHVKLTNKWWEISVTKMYWEHLLLEFLDIDNDEIGSLLVPGDYILVNVVLNRNASYLEDLISLWYENGRSRAFLFSPSSPLIEFFELFWALRLSWGWFLFCEHFLFFDTILN